MVSVEELRAALERHGLRLVKVTQFKHRDRIVVERPGRYKVMFSFRTKLENISLDSVLDFLGVLSCYSCEYFVSREYIEKETPHTLEALEKQHGPILGLCARHLKPLKKLEACSDFERR